VFVSDTTANEQNCSTLTSISLNTSSARLLISGKKMKNSKPSKKNYFLRTLVKLIYFYVLECWLSYINALWGMYWMENDTYKPVSGQLIKRKQDIKPNYHEKIILNLNTIFIQFLLLFSK
jgi:hypothetical protein